MKNLFDIRNRIGEFIDLFLTPWRGKTYEEYVKYQKASDFRTGLVIGWLVGYAAGILTVIFSYH